MCGRYSITTPYEELQRLFRLVGAPLNLGASYNVAPSHGVPIVRMEKEQRHLRFVRWGLVPSWAKTVGDKPLINARAETIFDKPSFRTAIRRRRCLVPANGFYEWQSTEQGPKQPHNIVLSEGGPFAMAGIWEDWMGADGSELESLAIVTTTANKTLAPIHHRMPVILQPSDYGLWLDTTTDLDQIRTLMKPAPDPMMRAYPISRLVNSVANDDARLIEPIELDAPPEPTDPQGDLFD